MRRRSTPIIILFFFICTDAYKGLGQGAPGKDPVAFEIANRDIHAQIMPEGITRSWYNEAVAKIEEREYFIRTTDRKGYFAAVNHAQHLGYLFSEKGYTVSNFNDDGSGKGIWRTQFIIEGIGRKDQLHASPLLRVSRMGDRSLQYEHRDYVVTYDNLRQGMEQSFIIRKRPAGHNELQIVLELDGDLQARMEKGDQLLLHTAAGPQDVKLAYDNFKVWDADKRPLAAHMRLTSAHRLVLSVDDRHAIYPLTVDPLNHTPNLTINLQGVLGTSVNETTGPVLAGFSISRVLDINGDGLSEVVIGAPQFTQISGISGGTATLTAVVQGAAFVYYSINPGLPATTPTQVLQPSGLAANANFGFSVASADLDNDGKGDIIVGAPSDISKINAALKTGNVYVYRGASLSTNVNVIPAFTQILSLGAGDLFALSVAPLYGFCVTRAGRVNNDAIDDIAVGAPGYENLTAGGRVDIFHGTGTPAAVSATPSHSVTANTNSLFGWSVSGAGNVNGDAFDDIVVGAPASLLTPSGSQGHVYVFHGSSTGITATDYTGANTTLSSPGGSGFHLNSLFGFSVASGDFNGDTHGDIIVGEPLTIANGGAAGRAHVYYGTASASGINTTPFTLTSPRSGGTGPNLLFGYSVGSAGNVKGDAADDALVGEPGIFPISHVTPALAAAFNVMNRTSTTAVSNGAAYLFTGAVGTGIVGGASPSWSFTNSGGPTDMLGAAVTGIGDVSGDGSADLLVSAPSGSLDLGQDFTAYSSSTPITLSTNGGLMGTGSIGNTYLFLGFSAALPVSLLSFTATADNGNTRLNWSTAQEQNSDHFDIEHSTDGINFSSIGQVAAAGNSSLKTDYSFTDATPAVGANYYRLKMVDRDGQFTYSRVAIVNFQAGGPSAVAAYPNPAHSSFSLVFKNMTPGTYRMSLVSVAGQEVMTKNIQVSNPIQHNESVILPSIAPGSYWIRLIDRQNHSFLSRLEVR
ncbi:MAG: FG-GAP repeat protein [Chitinophagaceae bacterium]|nr:FG-GAP repeat protein [Chitinophagaceae bacterium]